jgi:hypothetical protein
MSRYTADHKLNRQQCFEIGFSNPVMFVDDIIGIGDTQGSIALFLTLDVT